MIVVKIELHSAITGQESLLKEVVIWNNGQGDSDVGLYHAKMKQNGEVLDRAWFGSGYVGPFSHYRPDPVEKLVGIAFRELRLTQ